MATDHSLIHANGMGNYIVFDPDTRNRVLHKCACGGLMSEYAELCSDCDDKRRAGEREAANDAERLRIRREREQRFKAALAAGWTLPELFPWRDAENHNVDSLPTLDQINRRRVKNLITSYCRGMGE